MDAAMPDAAPNTSVQAYRTGVERDIGMPKERAANNATRGDVVLDTATDDFGTPAYKEKGKGKEIGFESCPPNTDGRLAALAAELIASILSYLSPIDLAHVSETCRALNVHATADNLWQAHVQDHVPGVRVTSSYPCPSFRHLFRAHHLRWFLPKYKIWFADTELPGRLVLVRYDQRRGCIEGYQVVAHNRQNGFHNWNADWKAGIFIFDPKVNLHLDHPILRLPADPSSRVDRPWTVGGITTVTLRRDVGDASHTVAGSSRPKTDQRQTGRRFRAEVPMQISPIDTLHVNFMHARILEPEDAANRISSCPFNYGNVWPPPAIPTPQRVLSNPQRDFTPLAPKSRPSCWQELSDRAFRIRKWITLGSCRGVEESGRISLMELKLFGPKTPCVTPRIPRIGISEGSEDEEPVLDMANIGDVLPAGARLAEQISTYATLDPELYTPTPTKPYRGIWVGDYDLHGCEFLWIHQPDDDDDDDDSGDILRHEDESDEAYARRRYDATVHRGRLEAVKLTGDANVPRGELSWVVDDLGEGGLVRIAEKAPFQGARVVRSRGHVADEGFQDEGYIDTQLILISPDRLAHHWASLRRIAYLHRVNIDELLVPR